jgi:hypothetical protein
MDNPKKIRRWIISENKGKTSIRKNPRYTQSSLIIHEKS